VRYTGISLGYQIRAAVARGAASLVLFAAIFIIR